MSRIAFRVTAAAAVIALLGVGSFAIAGGGSKNFRGDPMIGYEENPDVSTVATGTFEARLSEDGDSLEYELTYSGLEGAVTQSHVHFGKRAVNGGISFWLCQTPAVPAPAAVAALTPMCPVPGGTVEDEITAAEVIGPAVQGIEPMNFAEILAAMRAGHAYANVHSTKWLGGEIRAQLNDRRHGDDGDDD
jgi:CHRD domain